jgi:hypothetical protein
MGLLSSNMRGILSCLVLGLVTAARGQNFEPDQILRVTAENYNQACTDRFSVLVNGASPGPELRLQEDETTWIRVYNDMENENVTMVR